jgi:hypothetical protein
VAEGTPKKAIRKAKGSQESNGRKYEDTKKEKKKSKNK